MESQSELQVSENVILKQQNERLNQQNKILNERILKLEQKLSQVAVSKDKCEEQRKNQVAPKKCNHNHDHSGHKHQHKDHSHGHNHEHTHGHGHGHNSHNHAESSEQQNPSEPSTVPVSPPAQKSFLQKIFKTQEQINFRYFRLPLNTIKAWMKDEGIDLTKNKSCMLHLRQMKLNLEQFVKQTWQEVEWINLPECQIDDQGWRTIVQNQKAFPDLRVIGIRWNNIKTIKQGDLEQFKNLKMIDLGLQSQQNNPLTEESRQILKAFTQKYPHVKVQ